MKPHGICEECSDGFIHTNPIKDDKYLSEPLNIPIHPVAGPMLNDGLIFGDTPC